MQRQDDQFEHTYSSPAPIWDVALRTSWKQWTIGRGGKRGSGIFVLIAQHDDDDDMINNINNQCGCEYQLDTIINFQNDLEKVLFSGVIFHCIVLTKILSQCVISFYVTLLYIQKNELLWQRLLVHVTVSF